MKIKLLIFISIIFFSFVLASIIEAAFENLDELESRISRKTTNTFYSGEDLGNNYVWQPQNVIYTDTSTGHEVMIWSQLDDKGTMGQGRYYGPEYGWQAWSADGKRIAFLQDKDVGCFTRSSASNSPWFVARADGSYWRPICESASRTDGSGSYLRRYFNWSPTVPDVAYTTGENIDGNSGLDQNALYREVHSDTSISSTLIIDMIGGNTSTRTGYQLKDNLTEDGLYFLGSTATAGTFYVCQVEPSGLRTMKLSWTIPSLDDTWFTTPSSVTGLHDESLSGNATEGYWFYIMPSGSDVWWRMHLWGTDNGTPNHTTDNSSPYDWWTGTAAQQEVQVTHDEYGSVGTYPAFVTDDQLFGHTLYDRWGTHVASCNGNRWPVSLEILDISDNDDTWAIRGYYQTANGCGYPAWEGWTDYPAFVAHSGVVSIGLYNVVNTGYMISSTHTSSGGDFTHPTQSPDGTKVGVQSDWLNPTSDVGDLIISVPYFPYPPELTAVTATGGTVMATFEWMLDSTPRGYTTRGWPNEDSDDPPPPRETEKFRLWRSADKVTWIPVGTTDANIFTRYDFSDGTWDGNNYWTITDNPSDGTWYYAITSQEWSGLESRTLSNIYRITLSGGSGTASQDTAYPSSPRDLDNIDSSDFYMILPPGPINVVFTHKKAPATADGQYLIEWNEPDNEIIRYYNIYAEDGSIPTVDQKNRIASISKNSCKGRECFWVDWLGNKDGSTKYIVTSVDYQGNESNQSTSAPAPTYRQGDINKDGKVNSVDFILLIAKWWQTSDIVDEDLNNDGLVNARDLGILMREWFD